MTTNTMSIRLMPGGLSICGEKVSIQPGPDIVAQQKEAILSYLEEHPLADEPVLCEVCTERQTLIPASERAQATTMYHFVVPDSEREETVLIAPMEVEGMAEVPLMLYGIDTELYHFLERNLPQVTFTHPMVSLHGIFCLRSRQFARPVLFAHSDEEAMSLFLYDCQRLQLAVRYETSSVANRAYHLLNTWEQHHLDQQFDHLLLIGHAACTNQLRARIAQFIKRTEMMIQ